MTTTRILPTASEGDVIRWTIMTQGGPRLGVVKAVGTAAESAETDRLMSREPGTGLQEFGRLLLVQCDRSDCTSCKGGWKDGWLHAVNECQIEIIHDITPTIAVPLWK